MNDNFKELMDLSDKNHNELMKFYSDKQKKLSRSCIKLRARSSVG